MQKLSFTRAFVMDTESMQKAMRKRNNENKKEKKWNKFSL